MVAYGILLDCRRSWCCDGLHPGGACHGILYQLSASQGVHNSAQSKIESKRTKYEVQEGNQKRTREGTDREGRKGIEGKRREGNGRKGIEGKERKRRRSKPNRSDSVFR